MNARELVLDMLLEITEEKKLYHTVLSRAFSRQPDMEKKDRAFASALCTGCVERLLTLDCLIGHYSTAPVAKMKPVIRNILRMGFYQLYYMAVPASAICNEAVKLAKKRGLAGLSGFVNGVLRNAARNPLFPETAAEKLGTVQKLSVLYSVPEWLTERFISWYGEESTERMFRGFLGKSDLTVRVNLGRIGVRECRELLIRDGIQVRDGAYVKSALHIAGLDSVEKIEAFQKGFIQVQDESSMLPVLCAGIRAGDRIIDCCAAPGGKTVQAADALLAAEQRTAAEKQEEAERQGGIAATEHNGTVIPEQDDKNAGCGMVSARDISEYKLQRIRENVERAGYDNVEILLADALKLRKEDIGTADIVLADLPCSGLGIIGKKPDIKYNVTPEMLEELKKLQREILSVVVQYLKPGGVLIYSTCTVNKEENIENAEWIRKTLGMVPESLEPYLPEALHSEDTHRGWLQLLPELGKTDGFFISRFRKCETNALF